MFSASGEAKAVDPLTTLQPDKGSAPAHAPRSPHFGSFYEEFTSVIIKLRP